MRLADNQQGRLTKEREVMESVTVGKGNLAGKGSMQIDSLRKARLSLSIICKFLPRMNFLSYQRVNRYLPISEKVSSISTLNLNGM